jgi:hypothetical protein
MQQKADNKKIFRAELGVMGERRNLQRLREPCDIGQLVVCLLLAAFYMCLGDTIFLQTPIDRGKQREVGPP